MSFRVAAAAQPQAEAQAKLSWKNVFNTNHHFNWRVIYNAYDAARIAGYPYFVWNDVVYEVDALVDYRRTSFLIADIT